MNMYVPELLRRRMQCVIDALDAQEENASLEIRGPRFWGTRVLARIPLSKPSFIESVMPGDIILAPAFPVWAQMEWTAVATGTATVARLCDGNGRCVADGLTVGTRYGADIILNTTKLIAGKQFVMDRFKLTSARG